VGEFEIKLVQWMRCTWQPIEWTWWHRGCTLMHPRLPRLETSGSTRGAPVANHLSGGWPVGAACGAAPAPTHRHRETPPARPFRLRARFSNLPGKKRFTTADPRFGTNTECMDRMLGTWGPVLVMSSLACRIASRAHMNTPQQGLGASDCVVPRAGSRGRSASAHRDVQGSWAPREAVRRHVFHDAASTCT
jgi:hypothetical protein